MNPTVNDLLTLTVFLYLAYSWSSFLFIAVMASVNCFHLRREIKELEKIQGVYCDKYELLPLGSKIKEPKISVHDLSPEGIPDRVLRIRLSEVQSKTALSDMPFWIKEQNRDRMNRVHGSEVD